ncbi:MAG TPA: hypothetical protein VLW55_18240 [Burkholderiaceae bacterium]|nr:hypothetical protein [Burkholderiaceae bacterium]
MQELRATEMQEVSGGGTRIGTTGTGDGNVHAVGTGDPVALGGRVDPGGANGIAAPASF